MLQTERTTLVRVSKMPVQGWTTPAGLQMAPEGTQMSKQGCRRRRQYVLESCSSFVLHVLVAQHLELHSLSKRDIYQLIISLTQQTEAVIFISDLMEISTIVML